MQTVGFVLLMALASWALWEGSPPEPADFKPNDRRVLLLAIEGADWAVFNPLLEQLSLRFECLLAAHTYQSPDGKRCQIAEPDELILILPDHGSSRSTSASHGLRLDAQARTVLGISVMRGEACGK